MKIKVEGSRLQDGLKKVIGVANAKITPSILGNVLMAAKDGKVSLMATNLDITLITSVDCDVEEAGSTTVPAKMFQNVVSALPVGIVDIVVDKNEKMKVTSGESSFRISCQKASDFPKVASIKDDLVFSMGEKDLRSAIRKVSYAQSIDTTRRVLLGILFDFTGDYLKTVATDGRRLALAVTPAEWKCADTKFTVPTVAVKEIQRLLTDDGAVTIKFSNGIALFELEKSNTTVYAKTVDDSYPDYTKVIPTGTRFKAVCDRVRMSEMMTRAKVMALDSMPSVKLAFDNGVLDAKVVGMDDGEGRDKFAIKYDGEKTEFAFNPYYLYDTLSVIDSDDVTVEITSATSPILVKGEGESGLAVLMPLRMN